MSLVPFKIFVFALLIILVLLFSTGIVAFRKDPYQCLEPWEYRWREKVEIVHIGFLHIYAYPLTRDCDEAQRYEIAQ